MSLRKAARTKRKSVERLSAVAIQRGNEVHSELKGGSHKMLRDMLDPWMTPSDVEGFVTSTGRFVDRQEAKGVAIEAGQISHHWKAAQRDLLSSDIAW